MTDIKTLKNLEERTELWFYVPDSDIIMVETPTGLDFINGTTMSVNGLEHLNIPNHNYTVERFSSPYELQGTKKGAKLTRYYKMTHVNYPQQKE